MEIQTVGILIQQNLPNALCSLKFPPCDQQVAHIFQKQFLGWISTTQVDEPSGPLGDFLLAFRRGRFADIEIGLKDIQQIGEGFVDLVRFGRFAGAAQGRFDRLRFRFIGGKLNVRHEHSKQSDLHPVTWLLILYQLELFDRIGSSVRLDQRLCCTTSKQIVVRRKRQSS